MNPTWIDVIFLVVGGIAVGALAFCAWEMFQSWREGRVKPAHRLRTRDRVDSPPDQ